ncbi:MAG: hypothetical protein Q8Q33_03090 [Chlamydiota bacterium]|nr:hypothetical protein [Chlamydiota bacterium]
MTQVRKKLNNLRHEADASLIYRINLSETHYRAKELDHNDTGISFTSNLNLKSGTIVYIRRESCSPNCPAGKACESCRFVTFATVNKCRQSEDQGMDSYLVEAKYFAS